MKRLTDAVWGPSLKPLCDGIGRRLKPVEPYLRHRYLTLVARLVVGGTFIYSGTAKLGYYEGFIHLVRYYDDRIILDPDIFFPNPLATAYGYAMPPVELITGVLLLTGILLRFSATVSVLMTLSFIIAKSIIMAYEVDPPCGCAGAPTPEEMFGEWSALMVSQTIAISIIMFLLSLQILFHKGEVLAAGPWLWRRLPIPFPWLSRIAERFKKLFP